MRYLIPAWESLRENIRGRFVCLFADYDGTLIPIRKTPYGCTLEDETRSVLRSLSRNRLCKVAIISGRSLKDLKGYVRLKNIVYVGNHGLEIEGPGIRHAAIINPRQKKIIGDIRGLLESRLAEIRGALVEDKTETISVHYRLVRPEQIDSLKTIVYETTLLHEVRGDVTVNKGKKVLEILPRQDMDKGRIVMWLLARQKFAHGAEATAIYIGDDAADEKAFIALKDRGVTVRVGRPGGSRAGYYLRNQREVPLFLKLIDQFLRGG